MAGPTRISPGIGSAGPSTTFNENKNYFPIFYCVQPSAEYVAELQRELEENGVDAIAIPTTSGSDILSQVRSTGPLDPLTQPPPFASWDRTRIYEFFQTHIAPQPNQARDQGRYHFAAFTFIIIDASCLSDPEVPEIVVCCDAPDIGEGDSGSDDAEAILKCIPWRLKEAVRQLDSLELLTITPTEAAMEAKDVIMQQPPAWMVPKGPERPGAFVWGTPAQARKNRKRAIAQALATPAA